METMKNVTEKRKVGNLGEDLACRFLIKRGFDIIERNYLNECGEIDIIAKNKGKIHYRMFQAKQTTTVFLGPGTTCIHGNFTDWLILRRKYYFMSKNI